VSKKTRNKRTSFVRVVLLLMSIILSVVSTAKTAVYTEIETLNCWTHRKRQITSWWFTEWIPPIRCPDLTQDRTAWSWLSTAFIY